MNKLSAFGNDLIQVSSFEHFIKLDEKKRPVRRRGLSYYVLYKPEDPAHPGYLAPYIVSNDTDGEWLRGAITAGLVYLHRLDFQITQPKAD